MNNFDTDECSARGACSTAPSIAALEEIIILLLQKISYYKIELKKSGIPISEYDAEILDNITVLGYINDYNEDQLYKIILNGLDITKYFKEKYLKEIPSPKPLCDIPIQDDISKIKALSFGESILRAKYKNKRTTIQNMIELLIMAAKSTSINLKWLGTVQEDIFYKILSAFNFRNQKQIDNDSLIREYINDLSSINYNLQLKIGEQIIKNFGPIERTPVSFSTTNGKAILVSGTNLFELERILKYTKNSNIDIYTHSELLISHSLSKFKQYPNLKGHYGNSFKSPIMDFGTFPGAILLTENSPHTSDYYYRGRIFSIDNVEKKGIIKISDDNLSELIEAAQICKGFSSGKIKPQRIIGYNIENLTKLFDEISEKLKNGIKRIFIIWVNSYSKFQEEYFKILFNNLKEDEIVISLYYTSQNPKVYTIDMGQSIPLGLNMLNKLFERYHIDKKFVFYITTCDIMTFSDVIHLKNNGAENIYILSCPPAIINPSVLETFKKNYNIKTAATAYEDLIKIRNS